MRPWTVVVAMLLVASLAGAAEEHAEHAKAMAKAPSTHPGFEKIKTLIGDWQGSTVDGKTVTVSYRTTAGGNAVLETLDMADGSEMVTVYYVDGKRLMLTHYCIAQAHPRMRADAVAADGKTLAFKFVDAANLASAGDMHMHDLNVRFEDADHFTQEWVMHMQGKPQPMLMKFERRKA